MTGAATNVDIWPSSTRTSVCRWRCTSVKSASNTYTKRSRRRHLAPPEGEVSVKIRPLIIHSDDEKKLMRLRYDYEAYQGHAVSVRSNELTVWPRRNNSNHDRKGSR